MLRVNIDQPAAELLQNNEVDGSVIEESSRLASGRDFTAENRLIIIINIICLKQLIEVVTADVEAG